MRILIHDYAGHPFQVQLSRSLAQRGHTVHHAAAGGLQTPRGELAKKPRDPETFTSSEVAMPEGYAENKYKFKKRRDMEVAYGYSVGKLIRDLRPEAVLSANTPTEAQTQVVKACQSVGADFHYWLQDFYSLAVEKLVIKKSRLLGWAVGKYYRALDKSHFQASRSIVSITEDFAPLLRSQFRVSQEKIAVIPNWAPLETLPQRDKVNPWSLQQQLADKFVYLYSGTLGMKHNPQFLSELAKVNLANPDVRVVVISEGLGAEWLRAQKQAHQLSNLVLLPYQPMSQLAEVMATGDVLICVLEPDAGVFSVPSKVLSYLCAGRANLLAVPPENLSARLIIENQAGLTVAPDDQAGFLKNAETLRLSAQQREEMGRNSRAYAQTTFDIQSITDRFEELLVRKNG